MMKNRKKEIQMKEQMNRLTDLITYLNDETVRSATDIFTVNQNDNRTCIKFDDFDVITFTKDDWHIENDFGMLNSEVQKIIIEYVQRTSSADWFTHEKQYNIIVGPSYRDGCVAAYYKTEREDWYNVFNEVICLDSFVEKSDLTRQEYMFTEHEIECLKSTLPENMAKIVELGKIEVQENEDEQQRRDNSL